MWVVGDFDLLQKRELRIERIKLYGVNLTSVAAVVADVLGLKRHEVLVTDALDDTMTIDILCGAVDAYRLVGKKDRLLYELSRLPGVMITEATTVCSQGMLGWIALDRAQTKEALKLSENMAEEIRRRIAKRAVIFSTGFEVSSGQIEDTNKPTIARRLEVEGYSVTLGATLNDDSDLIAGRLRHAVESGGYGLVIVTGGVGAEAKDHTIEAIQALDPDAAAPYICRFEKGTGRHAKDGVRIGVGHISGALIVALPGPNNEVKIGLEVLIKGLASNLSKRDLAEKIARALRYDLRKKMRHYAQVPPHPSG